MKRSSALAPLSREHHEALEVALVLRRATVSLAPAVAKRFVEYVQQVGGRHFDDEERLLLGHLEAAVGDRLRRDHDALRAAAAACAGPQPTGIDDLHAAGRLLADHVRFEEREVFSTLEEELSADDLEALGRQLVALGHSAAGPTADGSRGRPAGDGD